MKKILTLVLAGVMVAGLSIGTARAGNSLQQGAIGLSVGIGSDSLDLSGRYFMYDNLALLGGLGLKLQGGDLDHIYLNISGGARRYLSNEDLVFFFGGTASYLNSNRNESDEDENRFSILGNLGAEYFFMERFSVEGSVGAGFALGKEGDDGFYSIGTFTRGLAANFYF